MSDKIKPCDISENGYCRTHDESAIYVDDSCPVGRRTPDARLEAERDVIEEISLRLDADPHQWSKRPCATCSTISARIGKDFGCVAYAKSPLTYTDYGRDALAALARTEKKS